MLQITELHLSDDLTNRKGRPSLLCDGMEDKGNVTSAGPEKRPISLRVSTILSSLS